MCSHSCINHNCLSCHRRTLHLLQQCRFQLNPSVDGANLKEDEVEARKVLKDLGITDDLVKDASGKDSRSSITGTYRIVLHRIQKRNSSLGDETDHSATPDKENMKPDMGKKQSRFCAIL